MKAPFPTFTDYLSNVVLHFVFFVLRNFFVTVVPRVLTGSPDSLRIFGNGFWQPAQMPPITVNWFAKEPEDETTRLLRQ